MKSARLEPIGSQHLARLHIGVGAYILRDLDGVPHLLYNNHYRAENSLRSHGVTKHPDTFGSRFPPSSKMLAAICISVGNMGK